MAHILWSQDFFAKGELSPLMYSRVTLNAYYQGLKRAKNVLCLPQGSAGKRFGTRFVYQLGDSVTDYRQVYFKTFQYLNECCYLLLFYNNGIAIFLEDELVANLGGTGIMADEVQLWKDVNGILTADPRLAPNAQSISHLSFVEAAELARLRRTAEKADAGDPREGRVRPDESRLGGEAPPERPGRADAPREEDPALRHRRGRLSRRRGWRHRRAGFGGNRLALLHVKVENRDLRPRVTQRPYGGKPKARCATGDDGG